MKVSRLDLDIVAKPSNDDTARLVAEYAWPRNRWSVTAYGENLTNRAVYTSGARDPFTTGAYFAGSIQNPRIYGAKFNIKF